MDKDWLLKTLETRFNENMHRHENLKWENVLQKLETQPKKLEILQKMENFGGEPDVVGFDEKSG